MYVIVLTMWVVVVANQAGNALFACVSLFFVHFPSTPTRIPRISHQRTSTLELVLTNGMHEVCDLSTRTALASDHLLVLFEVELNDGRKVLEHFVFNYKNAEWALFRREMDYRVDLNFSLDRVGSGADVDSMLRTVTEAVLEARGAAAPLVRSSRFCLAPFPQIKCRLI
jgi:hypothetical protein